MGGQGGLREAGWRPMGGQALATGCNAMVALVVASVIFGWAGGSGPKVSGEDGMMVKADAVREHTVPDRGDGRDPLVSVEILEDPWTPAWEVARIANAVRWRAEDLPGAA